MGFKAYNRIFKENNTLSADGLHSIDALCKKALELLSWFDEGGFARSPITDARKIEELKSIVAEIRRRNSGVVNSDFEMP